MAYYSSIYPAAADYGEYQFNPYGVNYDSASTQDFMGYSSYDVNCDSVSNQALMGYSNYGVSYDSSSNQALMGNSNYEFNHQPFFGSYPTPYHRAYDPSLSYSTIAYSATTLSEPKLIQYDPNSAVTQLVISYSVSNEFNEPEFEEYDPTPYGGGYDPTLTYGKPLPPSDEICYPRSKPNSDALSSDGVASGFIPLPKIEEEINDKAIIPSNERSNQVIEAEPDSHDSIKNGKTEDTHNGKPNQGDEFYSGYDSGRELDNGYTGEPCYEYENQVPSQIPSGYGLEAMDLCESLFGYWPCLSRMKKRGNGCQVVANEENEIAECADYLFGNSYPYFERGEDGSSYGNVLRAYQRHYPAQAQPGQLEYSQHPW